MRYLSAPWVGLLRDGVWLRGAGQVNAMVERLESQLRQLAEVNILFPRQANAVFADLPSAANDAMWKRRWLFYTFIGKGACRLMCARDTVKADMDAIVTDLKSVL